MQLAGKYCSLKLFSAKSQHYDFISVCWLRFLRKCGLCIVNVFLMKKKRAAATSAGEY